MARPKPDSAKVKARIVAEAEAQLQQTEGRRLVLSELAARVGMSQSYVHTFFPTKADLVRTLAIKWFAAVEEASQAAAHSSEPAWARLENWVLAILQIKRDRFDANPALFKAYLELAGNHMDLVQQHVETLRKDLAHVAKDLVPKSEVESTVTLIEDVTLLFRTPQNIANYRTRATDAAARAVCVLLRKQLAKTSTA